MWRGIFIAHQLLVSTAPNTVVEIKKHFNLMYHLDTFYHFHAEKTKNLLLNIFENKMQFISITPANKKVRTIQRDEGLLSWLTQIYSSDYRSYINFYFQKIFILYCCNKEIKVQLEAESAIGTSRLISAEQITNLKNLYRINCNSHNREKVDNSDPS